MLPHAGSLSGTREVLTPLLPTRSTAAPPAVCRLLPLDPAVEAAVRAAADGVSGLSVARTDLASLFQEGTPATEVGCVVAPLAFAGHDFTSLPRSLYFQPSAWTVLFVLPRPEIEAVAATTRNGATGFLLMPAEIPLWTDAIARACEASRRAVPAVAACRNARDKLALLTTSECQVVDLMLCGCSNKQIASRLDMALRTVELRRKDIFTKLQTRSTADIVEMIHQADRSLTESGTSPYLVPAPHFLQQRKISLTEASCARIEPV